MDTDVVVVGLGYTGLPMAVAAARRGFSVVGLDASPARTAEITAGQPGCGRTMVTESELAALLAGPLRVSNGPAPVAPVHVLCVPSRDLLAAVDMVVGRLRDGDLLIVQSTCPPGMIDDVVIPRLRSGTDALIQVVHSPVRLSPGREQLPHVSRVVAGADSNCLAAGVRFLRELGENVVPVGAIRVAELTKVFENTFRLVNISLVNELAGLCREMDVDVVEVLDAAATKPFGFLRHLPGTGAGGDCVPVCAEFFAAAVQARGGVARTVEAAIEVNQSMPGTVARQLPVQGRRVLVAGVTYKPDVADMRRSAAVRLLDELRTRTEVSYHDPYVPSLRLKDGTELHSQPVEPGVADLVVLLTKHQDMDVAGFGAPVIDCTHGLPRAGGDGDV
jgi:UDP-N-acetyl-D-glucosamine dehydrogenase